MQKPTQIDAWDFGSWLWWGSELQALTCRESTGKREDRSAGAQEDTLAAAPLSPGLQRLPGRRQCPGEAPFANPRLKGQSVA